MAPPWPFAREDKTPHSLNNLRPHTMSYTWTSPSSGLGTTSLQGHFDLVSLTESICRVSQKRYILNIQGYVWKAIFCFFGKYHCNSHFGPTKTYNNTIKITKKAKTIKKSKSNQRGQKFAVIFAQDDLKNIARIANAVQVTI